MNPISIGIAGYAGPLASAVRDALSERGHLVRMFGFSALEDAAGVNGVHRVIYFPFPPEPNRKNHDRLPEHLEAFKKFLSAASGSGVERVVLRSHAIAYGTNMKNPGLLDEGRVSLLPKNSLERRWLEAEQILFAGKNAVSNAPYTSCAMRLTSVLDAGEGDLISRMLRKRIASAMAGYDPQLQLLSLSDAAECLACAVLSDASGIINGAPAGTVPVKAALKAAVPVRLPVNGVMQKPVRNLFWKAGIAVHPGESMDRIKYNWTVSGERARADLGFTPQLSSAQALRQYLESTGRGKPERIKDEYDEFGLDPDYLARMDWWFNFLTRVFWRVEIEGMDNIPTAGSALLTANHRGFMPFDGVVHRHSIWKARGRHIRILVIPSLFKFPFLSDFLVKQGGVVASQVNTQKLFSRGSLVGVFPEGIEGAFRMYKGAYQLGDMHRNLFARMAIANGVPIIPSATIGHVEIFPILAKVKSSFVVRHTGWPFLPITPTFPLLPAPLPSKWHIRYLDPIPVDGYSRSDASNPKAVQELAGQVCRVMQSHIDDMLSRRKHIFFGSIFRKPGGDSTQNRAGAPSK